MALVLSHEMTSIASQAFHEQEQVCPSDGPLFSPPGFASHVDVAMMMPLNFQATMDLRVHGLARWPSFKKMGDKDLSCPHFRSLASPTTKTCPDPAPS